MQTIRMQFQVDKVQAARSLSENMVLAVQTDPAYINPMYKGGTLTLTVVSADELKKFGPGQTISVTVELP